jgi:hypothetical protein
MTENRGIRCSRTLTTQITCAGRLPSIGASYTHIESLQGVVAPETSRVVMYHAKLTSLRGLEVADNIEHAFLGFNRIHSFEPADKGIRVGVFDLAGNPLTSLQNAPVCRELIVSSTLVPDLVGAPEGIEMIRCGHSTHLKSLRGCPSTVKLIECSCAPNLVIEAEHLPPRLEELITDITDMQPWSQNQTGSACCGP